MVFFAKALNNNIVHKEGESKELKWFTKEEINNKEDLTDDVKAISIEILSIRD